MIHEHICQCTLGLLTNKASYILFDLLHQFFRRARRYGYTTKEYEMSSLIEEKDRALFRKITKDSEHVLYDLLPEMKHRTLRTQNHNYILPQIKTERFKRCFINRFNNF